MDENIDRRIQEVMVQFFAALGKRDFTKCKEFLTKLHRIAEVEPQANQWASYLEGVLIYSRDPDYTEAGRLWQQLHLQPLSTHLYAKVLLALGNFYQRQGEWLKAIETYRESVPFFEKLNQPLEKVKALQNIGNSCGRGFDNGDLSQKIIYQGIKASEQAIQILANVAENPKELCGPFYNTVGGLHFNLGNWQQSVDYYLQFLEISQLLDDRLNVGFVNGNLGEIYQKQGRLMPALDAYQTALEIFQELNEIREIPEVLANLAALYEEMGQRENAISYHEQTIIAVEELRAQLTAQENRMAYMSTAHHYYANAILYFISIGNEAQAFHYAERARAREYLDMLDIAQSPDEGIASPMTLAQVQERLPEDGLLLSYFTTGLYCHKLYRETQKKNIRRHRFPEDKILLFVATQTMLEMYELKIPPTKLTGIDSGSQHIWMDSQDTTYRMYLYDQLISPVARQLHAQKTLYIIPHGLLHPLPFLALLPDELATTISSLTYGLSATILLRERSQRPSTDRPCLAIGYNDTGKNQLMLAEHEAQRVATLMKGHCWQGAEKNNLLTTVDHYERLHFACHCEFQPSAPLESTLILGLEERLSAFEIQEQFRLKNCNLVVLSACDSGRHSILRGDELLGFVRAFLHAGAQNVIATLWAVDDCSTPILMERFYQEILAGHTPSSALLHAQHYLRQLTCAQICAILQQWSEDSDDPMTVTQINRIQEGFEQQFTERELIFAAPYYWAAFVLFQCDHSDSIIL